MKNRHMTLPNKNDFEYGYELAYKLACEKLASIKDVTEQCHKSGAKCQVIDSEKVIIIDYLNQAYRITLPDIEIKRGDSGEAVPVKDKILILHYFTQAKGTPLSNKPITYKELPEGTGYFRTFSKRAIQPFLTHFGKEPERLFEVAKIFGGYKADYGDVAVTINAFSRVPITFVLWQGDEEFSPEGNIIFDSTISDYLTVEDINVLCEAIAWKLVKSYQRC